MTEDDPIKAGILAAADDYERQHIATAAAVLDDSTAVASLRGMLDATREAPRGPLESIGRLHRAEAEQIAAWGELFQIPGFRLIEGETLPAAIRRALSEAANLKD